MCYYRDKRANCRQRLRELGAADVFLEAVKAHKDSGDGMLMGGLVLSLGR